MVNFSRNAISSQCTFSLHPLLAGKRILIPVPYAAPHSPRRQKLNLRMKSLSLDSPESTELHGQISRRRYPGGQVEHSTPPSNNSRLHCEWMRMIITRSPRDYRLLYLFYCSSFQSVAAAEAAPLRKSRPSHRLSRSAG